MLFRSRNSYPAVTTYVVRQAGKIVAHCDTTGQCDSIPAPVGESRTYEVTSQNDVGESADGVSVQAWAYLAPNAPRQVSATPVVTADGSGGLVSLTVSGIDTTHTGSVRIVTSAGVKQTVDAQGSDTVVVDRLEVPNRTTSITVTPVSSWQIPPDLEGSTTGEAVTITASGVGKPTGLSLNLSSSQGSGATAVITATGSASTNGDGSVLRYGVALSSKACSPTKESPYTQFSVTAGETYNYTMCVASLYGGVVYGTETVTEKVNAIQLPKAPNDYVFTVNAAAAGTDTEPVWLSTATPTSSETPPNNMVAQFDKPSGFGPNFADNYRVRYCHTQWADVCGEWGEVTPAPGGAPYPVQAAVGVATCTAGAPLQVERSSTMGKATIVYDYSKLEFFVDGSWVPVEDPHNPTVPVGATMYRQLGVNVSWPLSWGLTAHSVKPQQGLTGRCG